MAYTTIAERMFRDKRGKGIFLKKGAPNFREDISSKLRGGSAQKKKKGFRTAAFFGGRKDAASVVSNDGYFPVACSDSGDSRGGRRDQLPLIAAQRV